MGTYVSMIESYYGTLIDTAHDGIPDAAGGGWVNSLTVYCRQPWPSDLDILRLT